MNINETGICNAALRLAGAGDILNYHDDADRSAEAVQCRFFFPQVRQFVLEAHPWRCLATPATLTTTAATPGWTWRYAFVLPADFVRMIGMECADERYQTQAGRLLYCNVSPAKIEYIPLETDCTRYSAGLVRALVLNLAYDLSFALGTMAERGDRIKRDLEQFFWPLVRFIDATGRGRREHAPATLTAMFDY